MLWSKPKRENEDDPSLQEKRVDFGPRVTRSIPKIGAGMKENENTANITRSTNNSTSSFSSAEISERLKEVEKDRDQWKLKAESAALGVMENLSDMVVEVELETLREEVARLRALISSMSERTKTDAEKGLIAQRIRCAELETQVEVLKKEKLVLEQKNKDSRNAEISRVRALQEQITNERKLRERMANTESALPVVTVGPPPGAPSDTPAQVVTIKPRNASPVVPPFVAEPVGALRPSLPVVDPKSLAVTKVVLPKMKEPTSPKGGLETLGTDYIAEQWREFLKDKPIKWQEMISREYKSNNFKFGSIKVTCKKLANQTMIHFGSETMLIEKFIETYGPKEAGEQQPCLKLSAPQLAPPRKLVVEKSN